jgi:ATP-dependent Clp protease ATP-binding subunit ClpA
VAIREKIPTFLEVPLSAESRNVLWYCAEEANSLSHRGIKPEHLLLGLLREEGSLGAKILRENGVEYAAVRRELEGEA